MNKNYKSRKNITIKQNFKGGVSMKYFLILSTIITGLFAQNVNPQTGWSYEQSTLQAFYYLEDLTIDGVSAEGDGLAMPTAGTGDCYNQAMSCDVIGAFIDRCV
jgi:hypothetical protein